MRHSLAFWLGLSVLTGAATVHADDGFRCGTGRLVSLGDRMLEVRDRCGDPDAVSTRVEKRKVRHRFTRWVNGVQESTVEEREVDVPIDEWTYDLGPRAFLRYVTFENGFVVNVTTGGYGRKKPSPSPFPVLTLLIQTLPSPSLLRPSPASSLLG